jgi:adenine deaminase
MIVRPLLVALLAWATALTLPAEPVRWAHFLHGLPKAEMHIHFEGTLEPGSVLELARKNHLAAFPFASIDEIERRMGETKDLPSFIRIYEQMLSVVRTEDDFYQVAIRYFRRVRAQNVLYVELFFDPQMHTTRGIPFETVMAGLRRAHDEAEAVLGLHSVLILCFNRDRSAESAMKHLEMALPYRDLIIGVGTDNPEESGFPAKFAPVYARAAAEGFRLTAHCDVDIPGSAQNIRDCLDLLHVERIDHGVNILDDPALVALARERHIGFTVAPALIYGPVPGAFATGYFDRCALGAKAMLDAGLRVTLASDDPGLFCNQYVGDVYVAVRERLGLSAEDMTAFARNGFEMAWLKPAERAAYLARLDAYVKAFPGMQSAPR